MPNRIIRESVTSSASLDRLSPEAECLFYRLTVTADDHGAFDARPVVVWSRCYPLRPQDFDGGRVSLLLGELDGVATIHLYNVDGRAYGHFPAWSEHQRVRAVDSKWPSCDGTCGSRADSRFLDSSIPDSGKRGSGGETFNAFWAIYPRHQAKGAAQKAFAKALERATLATILAGAERYRDDPNRDPSFTAHASTWLNQDRWGDDALPSRGPESKAGRLLRIADQMEERTK